MLFRKRSFSDDDLLSIVEACRLQDPQAQRVLFKKFFSYAKSICLRYSATTEEAEEVLNEGFLKVFQHLHQYDTSLPFKAWLRTIMVNTAISNYRRYHKHQANLALEDVPEAPFDDQIVDRITADEILAIVQQLPSAWRTVFNLHVVDGYSLREIAEMLDANEATIRSHFLRGRQRLQQLVKQHYPQITSSNLGYYETR
ncbi:sigma-70 family RNA polymerase sigma factor [Rudanella paleaurantiibacter]|uniref:Sigma-70 family RNA polymerase sigma factor n=1 Tax=Rudanella paleaurantiibacter TaxID=2614655 RepID=A0A7J5TZH8_9BACT|nr:RNA polymerase sigma factor [Rudanella paleaurantiibacter]KAB7729306.1 sigma-70 family RNA polymerase sigma factor [Rudanella paleaurantiibacter]